MWISLFLLAIIGISSGAVVSGGVFTVLISVGLVPRFAGRTRTAKEVLKYENFVVAGTIFGGVLSIFQFKILFGFLFASVFGFFSGIFVGCLALSIAEMLDTIPVFSRRVKFKNLKLAINAVAIGKAVGSLVYFIKDYK